MFVTKLKAKKEEKKKFIIMISKSEVGSKMRIIIKMYN